MKRQWAFLRSAADQFHALQKLRIQAGNRASAIERGSDEGDSSRWRDWEARYSALEKQAMEELVEEAEFHPAFKPIQELKGMGPILTAQFLGLIQDFGRFDTVSKLWAYSGFRPDQGRGRDKLHNYSGRLKSMAGRIGTILMRTGGPYKAIYDESRELYDRTHPEWTKGHKHNASLRRMLKIFLSHSWEIGRLAQDLPIVEPYILEQRGHANKYHREDFMVKKKEKGHR